MPLSSDKKYSFVPSYSFFAGKNLLFKHVGPSKFFNLHMECARAISSSYSTICKRL